MKGRTLVWITVTVLILGLATSGVYLWASNQAKKAAITSGVVAPEIEAVVEEDTRCTYYTNEEFGFSLCYPIAWELPQEEKVSPSQQHLYQIKAGDYLIDLYDQPSPISLGSFVRGYFQTDGSETIWTHEVEVGDLEALQFFLPQPGLKAQGIGAVAFRKGAYVLTISTSIKPVPEGGFKQIVNESVLSRLAESFQWVD